MRDRLRVISMPFRRFVLPADFTGFLGGLAVPNPSTSPTCFLADVVFFLFLRAATRFLRLRMGMAPSGAGSRAPRNDSSGICAKVRVYASSPSWT